MDSTSGEAMGSSAPSCHCSGGIKYYETHMSPERLEKKSVKGVLFQQTINKSKQAILKDSILNSHVKTWIKNMNKRHYYTDFEVSPIKENGFPRGLLVTVPTH